MQYLIDMKYCNDCGREKAESEFNIHSRKADGSIRLRPYCRECQSERSRDYLDRNAEEVNTRKREYRRKNEKEICSRRDQNKRKARAFLNNNIVFNDFPRPDAQLCVDCSAPAEQYDHYKGYEREHWLDVEPVCVECHLKRTFGFKARRHV